MFLLCRVLANLCAGNKNYGANKARDTVKLLSHYSSVGGYTPLANPPDNGLAMLEFAVSQLSYPR